MTPVDLSTMSCLILSGLAWGEGFPGWRQRSHAQASDRGPGDNLEKRPETERNKMACRHFAWQKLPQHTTTWAGQCVKTPSALAASTLEGREHTAPLTRGPLSALPYTRFGQVGTLRILGRHTRNGSAQSHSRCTPGWRWCVVVMSWTAAGPLGVLEIIRRSFVPSKNNHKVYTPC